MLVVVSYDVSTIDKAGRRRLRMVSRLCSNYGQRAQNSVFECLVDPDQWIELKLQLLDIYDPEKDSLRFYFLGANYQKRIEHHGCKKPLDLEDPIIA